MAEPKDKKLYETVKRMADRKFLSRSGVHRSSWIVREYKKRGGKFKGSRPKNSGLKRWYREKWVDLNSPIRKRGKVVGYRKCGTNSRSKRYPLCRPTKRMSRSTPRTVSQLSKRSIRKAKQDKERVKHTRNIQFGGHSTSGTFIIGVVLGLLFLA